MGQISKKIRLGIFGDPRQTPGLTLMEVNATMNPSHDDNCLAAEVPDTESSFDPAEVSCSRHRLSSDLMCEIQTMACSLLSAIPM